MLGAGEADRFMVLLSGGMPAHLRALHRATERASEKRCSVDVIDGECLRGLHDRVSLVTVAAESRS